MINTPLRPRPATGVVLSLCALLTLTACDQAQSPPGEPAPTSADTTETDASVRTFTSRGQIVLMPDPSNPATERQIRHEHIPDFVGWDGKLHINADGVPGMKSMTMPFTAQPESLLDGLSVGDKVQFTMKMDLEGKRYWISALTKLDESVELDYTNKPAPPMAPEQAP